MQSVTGGSYSHLHPVEVLEQVLSEVGQLTELVSVQVSEVLIDLQLLLAARGDLWEDWLNYDLWEVVSSLHSLLVLSIDTVLELLQCHVWISQVILHLSHLLDGGNYLINLFGP